MNLKTTKKLYPKYQKWLLENYDKYTANKKQLKIMTSQKIITKRESNTFKNAIMIYEMVEDLVKQLKDVGVEITIN